MARTLAVRESARVAQIRLDTDSRVRRALLKPSIPTRGPYTQLEPMSTSSKLKGHKMTNETTDGLGLHGSFGVELRNPDDDPATDGGQPHSYWLRYGPSVTLATGGQLRFASEDELRMNCWQLMPHYAVQPDQVRGARQYLDVRSHTRPFGEMPHNGLADAPLPDIQEGDETDVIMDLPAGPGQH